MLYFYSQSTRCINLPPLNIRNRSSPLRDLDSEVSNSEKKRLSKKLKIFNKSKLLHLEIGFIKFNI